MTNRELLIKVLDGTLDVDDSGAMEEMMINYHIACPYRILTDGFCKDLSCDDIDNDLCIACKEDWLDKEFNV